MANETMQTGGSKKTWVFDPAQVEQMGQIRDALLAPSAEDEYFNDEDPMTTLAIVMDKILDDLPQDIAQAVSLVHLNGMSLRAAAKILKVDHKTVKARAQKGVDMMRVRLTDSVWVAEMLRGYLPADEITSTPIESSNNLVDVIRTLGDTDDNS